ncbi:MAG TPA: RNA polymerase sigma factor [Nevskiaceae bacterium]|nr:RNA polymerase sigma factor [Nevskiaceae bacterium]
MARFLEGWRLRRRQDPFEAALAPHIEHLYRLAFRFTRTTSTAEDLVQDVLVKLYRIRDQVLRIEHLRPWLARILYREYIDRWRHERLVPVNFSDLPEESGDRAVEAVADPADPAEHAQRMQDRDRLLAALAQLSDDHRAVVVFHDIEGYTLEELSIVLSLPLGTLKSRVHRARARLHELLGHPEETFSEGRPLSGT